MKKQLFLLAALVTLGVSLNFLGCSTPAPSTPAPSGPTPLCASPSHQGSVTIGVSVYPENFLETQAVTLVSAETATSISLYVGSGPVTGQVRLAIYGDTGANYPGNLIVETLPQNLVATSWNTASLPNVYLPAGTYWMGFHASNTFNDNYDSATGYERYYAAGWSVFPDTFPGSGSTFSSSWLYSLYLTTCP